MAAAVELDRGIMVRGGRGMIGSWQDEMGERLYNWATEICSTKLLSCGSRFSLSIVEDEEHPMLYGSLSLQASATAADVFKAIWSSTRGVVTTLLHGMTGYKAFIGR